MLQYSFSVRGKFPSCLAILLLTDWVLALHSVVVSHTMATEMSAITFILRAGGRQNGGRLFPQETPFVITKGKPSVVDFLL